MSARSSLDLQSRLMLSAEAALEHGSDDIATLSPHVGNGEGLTRRQARSLYLSHALSTWNARTYEFAAILFTAEAFPGTLMGSSLRGLSTTLATLLFSSSLGAAIDNTTTRLKPLLWSISFNRASVVLACFGWSIILLHAAPSQSGSEMTTTAIDTTNTVTGTAMFGRNELWLFAFVVAIGSVEKLSGVANMLSMERDWVPALVDPFSSNSTQVDSEHTQYTLTSLNAVMRRIDLICKLVAPLVISAVVEAKGVRYGVFVVGALSACTWPVEIATARWVWATNSRLRVPRAPRVISAPPSSTAVDARDERTVERASRHVAELIRTQWTQAHAYFATDVWVPSLALSLLHLSALSYSATFITYLLSSGFSLLVITSARAIGSIVEVSSTFIAPIGIKRLARTKENRPHRRHDADVDDGREMLYNPREEYDETNELELKKEHEVGLARSGLWGIVMQLASLLPVVLAIFQISASTSPLGTSPTLLESLIHPHLSTTFPILTPLTLFTFLSLSRLGLWVFDLTTQETTQTRVPSSMRSSFAGTEMAFVSLFELSQWLAAAIWSSPAQFRWLALGSLVAVGMSAGMYAAWVRGQRGHLVHWDKLGKACSGCARKH